jgi:serine/threonine-protein kinase
MRVEEWQRVFRAAEVALARAEGDPSISGDLPVDPGVRREVDRLLQVDPAVAPVLEQPYCRLADHERDRAERAAPSDDSDTQVGPYRIVRELGRGGMGVVYLADRVDGEFRRQVAVKVLKRGMDTDDFIRRFHTERQILADLCHPNIAELHDGGTTADGQPYLVMEYVEGVALDDYCAARSLTVRDRLDLFLKICAAVQHAHRSAVIHRDLKPGNILVTGDGEPKLLDFGIAKLLRPEGTGTQTGLMSALLRPMTPEYASPEQVLGKTITVGSDVYALGVMLYELLAGRPPYRLQSRAEAELHRVICGEEPARPSSALEPAEGANRGADLARVRRQLRADLDHIVLKALRKDPGERYLTVDELVEDLRRHLDGRPVGARKGTLGYRLGKLVRRHRVGVAAAVAVVAALVGVAVREDTQRRRISRERDKAEATAEFLKSLFDASDPQEAQPGTVTVREVLDRAARRVAGLDSRPEMEATYLGIIGVVYTNLGLYDQALALLTRALEINERLHGERHVDVATSLTEVGVALYNKGDLASAESYYRRALALREDLLDGNDPDLAEVSSNLGVLLEDKGDYAGAEPLLRRALDIYRRRLGPVNDLTVSVSNNLASLLHDKGELVEAEAIYRQALASYRALHGPEHPQVATALNNLALALADREDYPAAEATFRESLAMRRKLLGDNHPDTAQSVSAIGFILFCERRYDEAEPVLRDALERRNRILGPDNVATATTEITLARLLLATNRPAQAEPVARHALATFRHDLPDGNEWHVGLIESVLGASLTALGRFEEAEPLLVEGYATVRAKRGSDTPYTRIARAWLIEHYRARGMTTRAEEVQALATK